jgi:hypothetical protein
MRYLRCSSLLGGGLKGLAQQGARAPEKHSSHTALPVYASFDLVFKDLGFTISSNVQRGVPHPGCQPGALSPTFDCKLGAPTCSCLFQKALRIVSSSSDAGKERLGGERHAAMARGGSGQGGRLGGELLTANNGWTRPQQL